MKLRLAALLACMALSAPLAAQQFDTISFGVDGGYPPFDVLAPSGEITGFDIDIANALCTQLKAKCVFVKQPFESMIAALNAHKFDAIIASLNMTDARKKGSGLHRPLLPQRSAAGGAQRKPAAA